MKDVALVIVPRLVLFIVRLVSVSPWSTIIFLLVVGGLQVIGPVILGIGGVLLIVGHVLLVVVRLGRVYLGVLAEDEVHVL